VGKDYERVYHHEIDLHEHEIDLHEIDAPGESASLTDGVLNLHTSSSSAYVLLDGERHELHVGDYLVIHDVSPVGGERRVIGLVAGVERVAEAGRQLLRAEVNYLGVITEKGVAAYRTAPVPGALVRKAGSADLQQAYVREGEEWIRVGEVLTRSAEVPMCLNVNRMCTRHLAVLASTGAGKSNAVGVIAEELGKLGATVVIFDEHGEYTDGINTTAGGVPIVIKIPIARFFSGSEEESAVWCGRVMSHLLGLEAGSAEVMRAMFSQAWEQLKREIDGAGGLSGIGVKTPKDFWDKLVAVLETLFGEASDHRTAERLASLKIRIYEAARVYGRYMDTVGDRMVQDEIFPGRVNVIVLDAPDRVVDFVLESFVRDALRYRRRVVEEGEVAVSAFNLPVVLVLEEAHKYFPRSGGTGYPRTGWYLRTFAKEARKFGLGMILVSQRPQSVAQDVLTQCGTKVLMRMNDEADVRYVKNACDTLSEEVARYVMKFEPGECVITGAAVPMTLIGRFRLAETKVRGQDIDVVAQWREGLAGREERKGSLIGFNDAEREVLEEQRGTEQDDVDEEWIELFGPEPDDDEWMRR